jgi:hypothetical protein
MWAVADSGVVADSPQAIGTRVLRATTHLMDGLDTIHMTVSLSVPAQSRPSLAAGFGFIGSQTQRDIYVKSILPIGVLFSGSLILSNTAYLT